MTSVVDAALRYAAMGWRVFPVHGVGPDGQCTCGRKCSSPGKHPLTRNGYKDATVNQAEIVFAWEAYPYANVGVVTGEASRIVVLDVDTKARGYASLDAIQKEHGELPETVRALTGGGGEHLFFRHPGKRVRNAAGLAGYPGLDVRGDGGYVVAAPSSHVSGRRYEWLPGYAPLGWGNGGHAGVAELPTWLLELAGKRRRRSGTKSGRRVRSIGPVPEGRRNRTLFEEACGLRAMGAEAGELLEALRVRNRDCIPPLDDDELEQIADSAARYEPEPIFERPPVPEPPPHLVGNGRSERPGGQDRKERGQDTRGRVRKRQGGARVPRACEGDYGHGPRAIGPAPRDDRGGSRGTGRGAGAEDNSGGAQQGASARGREGDPGGLTPPHPNEPRVPTDVLLAVHIRSDDGPRFSWRSGQRAYSERDGTLYSAAEWRDSYDRDALQLILDRSDEITDVEAVEAHRHKRLKKAYGVWRLWAVPTFRALVRTLPEKGQVGGTTASEEADVAAIMRSVLSRGVQISETTANLNRNVSIIQLALENHEHQSTWRKVGNQGAWYKRGPRIAIRYEFVVAHGGRAAAGFTQHALASALREASIARSEVFTSSTRGYVINDDWLAEHFDLELDAEAEVPEPATSDAKGENDDPPF
jgi:hypothetical protein